MPVLVAYCNAQWGKFFWTCAFMKLRRSYAVAGYNAESHQVNIYPPGQQKYLLFPELLFPSSSFLSNCCTNDFLGEHSEGRFLVCFLLWCLLVFLFFCLDLGFLYGLLQILLFFVCFNVLLYIKRAELKKTQVRETRVLCHQIFGFGI